MNELTGTEDFFFHKCVLGNGMKGLDFSLPLYIGVFAALDVLSAFLVYKSYQDIPEHKCVAGLIVIFIAEYASTGIMDWQCIRSIYRNGEMTNRAMKVI